MRTAFTRITLTLLTLASLPAFAQEALENRAPAAPVIDGSEIASMGLSLVVVIAAILVVGWMYSRVRLGGGSGSDVINVVASRPLGPKERLMVIEIADQQLLVGMTASQLQTLHIFDSPVVSKPQASQDAGFAGRLRSALKEIGK